jgi:hypothetical protein
MSAEAMTSPSLHHDRPRVSRETRGTGLVSAFTNFTVPNGVPKLTNEVTLGEFWFVSATVSS